MKLKKMMGKMKNKLTEKKKEKKHIKGVDQEKPKKQTNLKKSFKLLKLSQV
jgi:hypothetical protein